MKYFIFLLVFITSISQAASKAELAQVRKNIANHVPAKFIGDLKPAPIKGFYQVSEGDNIVYYSQDGNTKIVGDILDLEKRVNYTQDARDDLFKAMYSKVFAKLTPKDYLAFSPKGKTLAHINVFTDTDCFYCQKLHKEVPALNKAGIEVRYFMYPRAGLDSATARELVSVWCADNPQEAMTKVKSRQSIPAKTCPNPISKHYQMANQLGLRGTPFIITDKGERINGYMPADRLIAHLLNK